MTSQVRICLIERVSLMVCLILRLIKLVVQQLHWVASSRHYVMDCFCLCGSCSLSDLVMSHSWWRPLQLWASYQLMRVAYPHLLKLRHYVLWVRVIHRLRNDLVQCELLLNFVDGRCCSLLLLLVQGRTRRHVNGRLGNVVMHILRIERGYLTGKSLMLHQNIVWLSTLRLTLRYLVRLILPEMLLMPINNGGHLIYLTLCCGCARIVLGLLCLPTHVCGLCNRYIWLRAA